MENVKKYSIFYATNRSHEGSNQWQPKRYGKSFSKDGAENLRFGKVEVLADSSKVKKYLNKKIKDLGIGDGEGLGSYLSKCSKKAKIKAYREGLNKKLPDSSQDKSKFGSTGFFSDLKKKMDKGSDVLIYIHGYNVSWEDAVGSAISLKESLNNNLDSSSKEIEIVLFSWPSDGSMMPFTAYKSDRLDAKNSGYSFGRGILKVVDFFEKLRSEVMQKKNTLCNQEIHLLCHSMGNYVLQNALEKIIKFSPSNNLRAVFSNIFLCAADVDENVFEDGRPMERLHELTRSITVYHNEGDSPLMISDKTKGNPRRLGQSGPARPNIIHDKIKQVDCTRVVHGIVEHSYYLNGNVNKDIARLSSLKLWQLKSELRSRNF